MKIILIVCALLAILFLCTILTMFNAAMLGVALWFWGYTISKGWLLLLGFIGMIAQVLGGVK